MDKTFARHRYLLTSVEKRLLQVSESIFENSLYCRFSLKRFSWGILTKSTPKIAINFFSCVYIVLKCPPNINLIYPWYYKSSGPFCFFEDFNMVGNQATCVSARIFHGKLIINIITWHHNKNHSYFKLHLKVFVVAHHEFGHEKISMEKSQVRRVSDHSIRDLAQFGMRSKRLVSYWVKKYFSFLS